MSPLPVSVVILSVPGDAPPGVIFEPNVRDTLPAFPVPDKMPPVLTATLIDGSEAFMISVPPWEVPSATVTLPVSEPVLATVKVPPNFTAVPPVYVLAPDNVNAVVAEPSPICSATLLVIEPLNVLLPAATVKVERLPVVFLMMLLPPEPI